MDVYCKNVNVLFCHVLKKCAIIRIYEKKCKKYINHYLIVN